MSEAFHYEKFKKFKRMILYHKFNGKCAYCGCGITFDEMTLDHIRAKANGGINSFKNYFPCCHKCNIFKGSKSVKELRTAIETTDDEEIKRKYAGWGGIFYFERVRW